MTIRGDKANVSHHISNEWNNAVMQCCVSDIVFSLTKQLNNVAILHAKYSTLRTYCQVEQEGGKHPRLKLVINTFPSIRVKLCCPFRSTYIWTCVYQGGSLN